MQRISGALAPTELICIVTVSHPFVSSVAGAAGGCGASAGGVASTGEAVTCMGAAGGCGASAAGAASSGEAVTCTGATGGSGNGASRTSGTCHEFGIDGIEFEEAAAREPEAAPLAMSTGNAYGASWCALSQASGLLRLQRGHLMSPAS